MVELAVIYFLLPDDRIVLQRRSQDAPTSPGMLGFFGGHVEKGESPRQALDREITDETSLQLDSLKIESIGDYYIKADESYPHDRHTFLYKSPIKDMEFEVFEGIKAEAYTIHEVQKRDDIIKRVKYLLRQEN